LTKLRLPAPRDRRSPLVNLETDDRFGNFGDPTRTRTPDQARPGGSPTPPWNPLRARAR